MPKSQLRAWAAAAVIAGVLALPPAARAAAAGAPAATPRPYPKGITCIWMPNLNSQSYTVIDDRHLVIQAPHGNRYLLTLARRCTELGTTLELRLARHDDQLCAPGDSIVTGRDRCPIQYLEGVASEAEAESLVDARAAAERAKRKPPGH
jgi:hypothetical protein